MNSIVDLELWSAPGSSLCLPSGRPVAERCRVDLGLPESVVLGLSFDSDDTDVQNLTLALQEGELTEADFRMFCSKHDAPATLTHTESAARFLAFSYGQSLAWLHFPATTSGAQMCRNVIHWARRENLCVVQATAQYCLLGETGVSLVWPADA